jgi:hypothetical protein
VCKRVAKTDLTVTSAGYGIMGDFVLIFVGERNQRAVVEGGE